MKLPLILLRFIVLVAVQVLVLNNIYLWQLINPLIYIYFIIKLPYQTPRWALLVWGFALGLTIDIFCGTPGMNAAATLLAAYLKPFLTGISTGRRDFDSDAAPSAREMGSAWYLLAGTITLFHHFFLYLLEDFGNGHWATLLLRTTVNSAATLLVMTLTEYLFARVKN